MAEIGMKNRLLEIIMIGLHVQKDNNSQQHSHWDIKRLAMQLAAINGNGQRLRNPFPNPESPQ